MSLDVIEWSNNRCPEIIRQIPFFFSEKSIFKTCDIWIKNFLLTFFSGLSDRNC